MSDRIYMIYISHEVISDRIYMICDIHFSQVMSDRIYMICDIHFSSSYIWKDMYDMWYTFLFKLYLKEYIWYVIYISLQVISERICMICDIHFSSSYIWKDMYEIYFSPSYGQWNLKISKTSIAMDVLKETIPLNL